MTTSEQASKGNWQARLDNYITSKATPTNIEAIRESCPFQLLTHGVIGFGFGAFLGLFMASVSTSAPEYALQVPPVPNGINANGMTLARSQAKTIIKDMAKGRGHLQRVLERLLPFIVDPSA